MKIVYDENEKKRIQDIHKEMNGVIFSPETPKEKIYAVTFTVTDPALAEYYLLGMLRNKLDPDKFDIGINVRSIEFNPLVDKSTIKSRFIDLINEIL